MSADRGVEVWLGGAWGILYSSDVVIIAFWGLVPGRSSTGTDEESVVCGVNLSGYLDSHR